MRFTIASGTSPLDGFTIKRGVGIGGFGEVYFAVSDSGKEVALKRIARNLDVELRGVRQCLNLKHANLIGLWDIKKDHLGESWVVMEFVSGPSLRDEIMANESGLQMDDVVWWFQGICAGVHYLHQNGIVHRDLKPGNIFQDNEAQLVKIGDYGLSKFISGSKRSGHTESVGTVHYMAPEIGRGIYGREIDIYSLGVILFELVTGKVPFDGESTQEIIMKHMTAQPDVSVLPVEFQNVVEKCLVKDPVKRYDSVLAMIRDLPGEFMPPSLRRSASYLEDTDHYRASNKKEEETTNLKEEKSKESTIGNRTEENQNGTPSSGQNAGQSPSPYMPPPPVSPANHIPAEENRPARNQAQEEIVFSNPGRNVSPTPTHPPAGKRQSRFNQKPGTSGHPASAQNSPAHSPAPAQHIDINQKLGSVGQAMVFGEVVHHSSHPAVSTSEPNQPQGPPANSTQIVTAQLVRNTPAPPLPGKSGNSRPSPFGNRSGKLSAQQRKAMAQGRQYKAAAARYLQRIPGVEQLSKMVGGWLVSSVLVLVVLSLFTLTNPPINSFAGFVQFEVNENQFYFNSSFLSQSALLWFAIVALTCNITILSVTRLWGPETGANWKRILTIGIAVLTTATMASVLKSAMDSPIYVLGYSKPLFIGAMGSVLFSSERDPINLIRETPTWFAFFVYFSGMIFLFPWWTVLSPLRTKRISLWAILYCSLLGLLLSPFVNFHMIYSMVLGALIGLGTQAGAYWFSDSQRHEIQSIARTFPN